MAVEENKKLILRDILAIDRTKMANNRTLLAFVRTSIYFFASAVAINHVEKLEDYTLVGRLFTIISVLLLVIGIANYFVHRKKINKLYNTKEDR
jgi:putative membrane protein